MNPAATPFACVASAWQAHEGELLGYLAHRLGDPAAADAAILRACDLGGETQRSFANRQGIGLPAVKSRLQRARQRLRDRMVKACQVDLDADGRVAGHVPRRDPPS